MHEIEVFLMVDQDGDYVVTKDQSTLGEAYESEISGTPPSVSRTYRLVLKVPVPIAIEVKGTLPLAVERPAELAITPQ